MAKTIVITGASDGIGAAAAQVLAQRGHTVIVVGRSPAKTRAVAQQVGAARYFVADYEDLSQVRRLAGQLREACPRIDVLANNAGAVFNGPRATVDGFEVTFQVNHLAGFLLTGQLMDVLLASRASVVNTSSLGARMFGHMDIDDLGDWKDFSSARAYGNSKLANILFAKQLHERYHALGLSAVAFHPGNVATNFSSGVRTYFRALYGSVLRVFLTSAHKGGKTLAHFAEGIPGQDWISGEYYDNHLRVSRTCPQAYDTALARQLWDRSAEMVGLSPQPGLPQ